MNKDQFAGICFLLFLIAVNTSPSTGNMFLALICLWAAMWKGYK